MNVLALTPVDLALALFAATLLGGLAGYCVRWLQERRSEATASTRGHRAASSRATDPRLYGGPGAPGSYPGLRRGDRPAPVPRDPWHAELPLDVEASAHATSSAGRPTVLVVDDRLELRAVHSTYLQQHGYNVLLAADGESALDMVRSHRPAVVVLDHSLPGRTGIEVTRELKSDPRTARIPVILMTAHSYGAIGMAAKEAGVAAFLPKPVDPSRVLREVERHMRVDVHDA
jgi:CheY-like chemotaxis protein